MTTDYRKEIRSFYDKLIAIETNLRDSYLDGAIPGFYHETMDVFLAPDLLAQGIKNISSNPSLAEGFILDSIYKLQSLERDSYLRKKTRIDYFYDAVTDSASEMHRLDMSKFNSLQFVTGNSNIQRKSND